MRGSGPDVSGTRKRTRQPSPGQGLARAVGALGGAGRAGLAEHAVLAGPQDGAGTLPAHHALLRPQLEDHLRARREAPLGWGRLPSCGHPGARRGREDPPQASGVGLGSQGLRPHRARGGELGRRPVEGPGQDGPQLLNSLCREKPKPVYRPFGDEVCAGRAREVTCVTGRSGQPPDAPSSNKMPGVEGSSC